MVGEVADEWSVYCVRRLSSVAGISDSNPAAVIKSPVCGYPYSVKESVTMILIYVPFPEYDLTKYVTGLCFMCASAVCMF